MELSRETHLFRFRGDNVNTINELVNNVIWHSKINGLNDPFEMFFKFDYAALKEMPNADLAKLIQKSVYYRNNKETVQQYFLEKNLEPLYQVIYDFWGEKLKDGMLKVFHSSVAVACFTKTYDSRLMWGYYGNGMKGICFAYNKEKLNKCGIEFDDVEYRDTPPKINIFKHVLERLRSNQVTIDGSFSLIKHTDWEKEEEVRSLKLLRKEEYYEHLPGYAFTLNECCIDAVIIGERLTGDMRVFIEGFSRRNNIKLFIAQADFMSYKVQLIEQDL